LWCCSIFAIYTGQLQLVDLAALNTDRHKSVDDPHHVGGIGMRIMMVMMLAVLTQ
jgi:tRNA G37 N-methylase TrmD